MSVVPSSNPIRSAPPTARPMKQLSAHLRLSPESRGQRRLRDAQPFAAVENALCGEKNEIAQLIESWPAYQADRSDSRVPPRRVPLICFIYLSRLWQLPQSTRRAACIPNLVSTCLEGVPHAFTQSSCDALPGTRAGNAAQVTSAASIMAAPKAKLDAIANLSASTIGWMPSASPGRTRSARSTVSPSNPGMVEPQPRTKRITHPERATPIAPPRERTNDIDPVALPSVSRGTAFYDDDRVRHPNRFRDREWPGHQERGSGLRQRTSPAAPTPRSRDRLHDQVS